MASNRLCFPLILFLFEIVILIRYGTVVQFPGYAKGDASTVENEESVSEFNKSYPILQDVNVMMFIGFGLLMTFMRHGGFQAMGFTFLITVVSIQLYPLLGGLWHNVFKAHWEMISLKYITFIMSLYSAAGILIAYGALIGKITMLHTIILVIFQTFLYSLNEGIAMLVIKANDIGGSMIIHAFSCYFGLAVS